MRAALWLAIGALFCVSGNASSVPPEVSSLWSRVLEVGLDVYTPVSPEIGDGLCRQHGLLFRQGVKDGQLWALHMLDASSKLPSGLLTGNLVQLGNFDQCLSVSHVHPELGPITGQHCLVSLGVRNIFSALSIQAKTAAGGINGTGLHEVESLLAQARFSEALGLVGATWSLCVPASCSPLHLQTHLRDVLGVGVDVDELACTSREDVDVGVGVSDVAVLFILGCLGIFVILGTAYDLRTQEAQTPRNPYLVAFSLYTNARSLLQTSTNPQNLASLDAIRCIGTLWVILIHYFVFRLAAPAVNMTALNAMSKDWAHLFAANGSLSVDTFLLMSGLLICYNYLRDRDGRVAFSLQRYYLNRYFRLTPIYATMILLTATILTSSSDAPLVKVNAQPTRSSCAEKGWLGLVYIANYLDTERSCVGVAWHLSVDMQLFWISPLLLYPLWKRPRLGLTLLFATILAASATVFLTSYLNQMPLLNLFLHSTTSKEGVLLYYPTHTRTTPWLIGLALGYLLHATKGRTMPLSRLGAGLGWANSAGLLGYAFLAAHPYLQDDAVYEPRATATYLTMMRPAWALGLGWVIFACERGLGGCVNAFLAWPGWQTPSRLTYAVFFTHWLLVTGFPVLAKTPQHFNTLSMMTEYIGIVVLSFAIGVLFHLTIEVPSIILYRLQSEKLCTKKILKLKK